MAQKVKQTHFLLLSNTMMSMILGYVVSAVLWFKQVPIHYVLSMNYNMYYSL